jgi:hypothetical protein
MDGRPPASLVFVHKFRYSCSQALRGGEILPSFFALPHEKSAFVLFREPHSLEIFSNSAPRSPLGSCSFAKRAEVENMGSLRQIFREAIGSVAVVLAQRFRIRLFPRRLAWENE